jgi:hypothetical protein
MPFSKLADGIATWRAFRTCCERGFFDCASTLCFTERGRSSLKELKGRKSQASTSCFSPSQRSPLVRLMQGRA